MVDARIIVVIAVALLIGGIVVASGSLQPAGWTTDGEIQGAHQWEGKVELSDTEYATAWKSGEESEHITAQGFSRLTDFSVHTFTNYYYVATLEGVQVARHPTSGWIPVPPAQIIRNVWYPKEAWTFTLSGELFGRLKVQMVAQLNAGWPWEDWQGDFGWDGAELKSGLGEILLFDDPGPFAEGETARVRAKTGFTNGAGWEVWLRPPLTRPNLFPVTTIATLGDNTDEIISIVIEEGWFIEGSWEDNTLTAELYNTLFQVGFEQIFTIDDRARAPTKPATDYTLSGNTATITAVSQATFKNIKEFVVWAWYGSQTMPTIDDSQSWIQNGVEYTPSSFGDNYSVTFDVQAKNFDGNIVVKIVASDTDGRTSTPSFVSLKVEDGGFEIGPKLTQPFIWSIMVSLLIALGLIFGFIVAYYVWTVTGSPGMTMFAFLIIFGVFGVGAFVAGSVPSIATLLGLSIGGI